MLTWAAGTPAEPKPSMAVSHIFPGGSWVVRSGVISKVTRIVLRYNLI